MRVASWCILCLLTFIDDSWDMGIMEYWFSSSCPHIKWWCFKHDRTTSGKKEPLLQVNRKIGHQLVQTGLVQRARLCRCQPNNYKILTTGWISSPTLFSCHYLSFLSSPFYFVLGSYFPKEKEEFHGPTSHLPKPVRRVATGLQNPNLILDPHMVGIGQSSSITTIQPWRQAHANIHYMHHLHCCC